MAENPSSSTKGLFEPLLPPPFQVSDTDKGAYVVLTAATMIVTAGCVVCVKLHVAVSTFRTLRSNDIALIAALVSALGYTVAICEAVRHGLGSAAIILTGEQIRVLSEYYYASNFMLYLSLACAKCSVALLIIAFQPNPWILRTLCAILAITIFWAVAAVFIFAFQCSPNRWALGTTQDDTCIDQFQAQAALRGVDIGLDVVLSVLPAFMMAGLQTPISRRLIVSSLFGLRLSTPVIASIALASLHRFYRTPIADRTFDIFVPSIWTSVNINISLITACIPSIKQFFNDWTAGVANASLVETYEMQSSANRSKTGRVPGSSSGSRLRSSARRKIQRDTDRSIMGTEGRDGRGDVADDGDSKKGLTSGILQTTEFEVQYNDIDTGVDNTHAMAAMRQ